MNAIVALYSKPALINKALYPVLILLLLACNLGGALQESGTDGGGETEVPQSSGGASGDGPGVPTPAPTMENEEDPEGAGDIDPSEPLTCPAEVTTYELYASHDFWTETGLGKWQWEAFGTVLLDINGPELVGGQAEGILEGRQFGSFTDGENSCQFEAPAQIHVTVFGSCQGGLLTLEITEDWQMGKYTWVCDEDLIEFNLPSMGPSNHPGIVFSLAELGSDKFEVPWGGGGGTKAWSLDEDLELVPLVP